MFKIKYMPGQDDVKPIDDDLKADLMDAACCVHETLSPKELDELERTIEREKVE